jgi:hypothetical protein
MRISRLMTAIQLHRGAASACLALAILAVQFAALRFAPSEVVVRIVLPATIMAVPATLWVYRDRLGVWVMYVGLAANLAPILANGGLMPIHRDTVVQAIGEERAARYTPGEWVAGSKDVLVGEGGGRLIQLGDQIIIRLGDGGMVASPGDVVVWFGLLILAAEASVSWQRRQRSARAVTGVAQPVAEGGAAT